MSVLSGFNTLTQTRMVSGRSKWSRSLHMAIMPSCAVSWDASSGYGGWRSILGLGLGLDFDMFPQENNEPRYVKICRELGEPGYHWCLATSGYNSE